MNILKIVREDQVWEVSGARIIVNKVFSKAGFATIFNCSIGKYSALSIRDIKCGVCLG